MQRGNLRLCRTTHPWAVVITQLKSGDAVSIPWAFYSTAACAELTVSFFRRNGVTAELSGPKENS